MLYYVFAHAAAAAPPLPVGERRDFCYFICICILCVFADICTSLMGSCHIFSQTLTRRRMSTIVCIVCSGSALSVRKCVQNLWIWIWMQIKKIRLGDDCVRWNVVNGPAAAMPERGIWFVCRKLRINWINRMHSFSIPPQVATHFRSIFFPDSSGDHFRKLNIIHMLAVHKKWKPFFPLSRGFQIEKNDDGPLDCIE